MNNKQQLIDENVKYIKTLVDNIIAGKQMVVDTSEYNTLCNTYYKIVSDLSILISFPLDSDNVEQIIGYEKCLKVVADILSQVLIGEIDVFEKKEKYIH
jgi:hypothetical protein